MLYFVGSAEGANKPTAQITASRAQYETDRLNLLVRLYRGVYCNEDDVENLPAFMRKNATRIANYLYRGAALSHASAYFKGTVEADGSTPEKPRFKLFIAGSYAHKAEMQFLEIVQTDALKNGRIGQFCHALSDNQDRTYGPMFLGCLSDEIVYLQQFGRRRYNLERFLAEPALLALRASLIERHGEALVTRLRTVADEVSDFASELTGALAHVRAEHSTQRLGAMPRPYAPSVAPGNAGGDGINKVHEFTLAWYRRPIARMDYDGVSWSFVYEDNWKLPLSVGRTRNDVVPPFVHNVFPEGYLLDAINASMGPGSGQQANVMGHSRRFLSNLSIVQSPDMLKELPVDRLAGGLHQHVSDAAVFKGKLQGMPDVTGRAIGELNRLLTSIDMPREPGNQPKIPCYLDYDGTLMPAENKPFTHILKLPGIYKDQNSLRGVVEWASMSLARGGGLKTCDFALVEMGNGALGYACERFDIPQNDDDMRMIYAEDFCSVHSKGPNFKMFAEDGVEALTAGFKNVATPNRTDDEQLFRMIYTNYLLENGDFHLKNASIIRIAAPTLQEFRSTRLAPAYDIMNTRFFADFHLPDDKRETMVLDYRGKSTGFTPEDFHQIAEPIGLAPDKVDQLMRETAIGIAHAASDLASRLPPAVLKNEKAKAVVTQILDRAVRLCHEDFPEIPLMCAKTLDESMSPVVDQEQVDPDMMNQVRRALGRK